MEILPFPRKLIKGFIFFSLFFFILDLTYKTIYQISYLTREKCILYRIFPKVGFLFYEYFIELFLIVVIGVFFAVLIETYFSRYKRFYPKNSATAFLYASLFPVCACTVIPLISTMREKLNFRTIMTFCIAAPLLSPYIIILSFSVLGLKYTAIRIVSAFILSIASGAIIEFFYNSDKEDSLLFYPCKDEGCVSENQDIYFKTYNITLKILPFLIASGILGILIELTAPANFLTTHYLSNDLIGLLIAILVGIPIYLCHGAEVLFLRPLIHQYGLSLGNAIAFSLASTSICITSLVLLYKILGKRLTIILLISIFTITLFLGLLINFIF